MAIATANMWICDINEALAMQKQIPEYTYEICRSLSHNYDKNEKSKRVK